MTKVVIKAADGTGAVESYHNANKKLETTSAGVTVTGNIAVTGTVDGRDLATDGTKLDGIEASATADQSNAEIRAAVEAATDSNVFTDADHTKLNGIASSATSVGGATGVDFNDNVKVRFGTGNDLEIYHDATNSTIDNKTGDLYIKSVSDVFITPGTTEAGVYIRHNGAVELYHDNIKTLETDVNGAKVLGPEGGSANLYLYGDEGDDNNDKWVFIANDGEFSLQNYTSGSWEKNIECNGNGAVELYYDNAQVFETASNGIKVLNPSGNGTLSIIGSEGNDAILQFKADDGDDAADHWRIVGDADGSLYIQNWTASAWETNIKGTGNGNVELYYDNAKKFETQADGVTFVEHAFFGDNDRAKFGAGNDLQIYHDGTVNVIDSNTCDLEIRHGGEVMAKFHDDEGVKLMYNNNKKFEVTNLGIEVTGTTNATIGAAAGTLILESTHNDVLIKSSDDIFLQPQDGEDGIKVIGNGAVELYHNNILQCETADNGLALPSGKGISFGASSNYTGKTSELLDDYEEGTFEAAPQNSVTLHASIKDCFYTKIGRLVQLQGQIRVADDNSNALLVIAIPFAADNGPDSSGHSVGALRTHSHNYVSAQSYGSFVLIADGWSEMRFQYNKDNAANENIAAQDNAYYCFSIVYTAT